jgi:hypothetical protein
MRIPVALFLIALVLSLPSLAAAVKSCPLTPDIMSLEDTVISGLDRPGAVRSKRSAAEAAYLEMHYGHMSEQQIEALLLKIADGDALQAHGLTYTYFLSRYGAAATQHLGAKFLTYYDDHEYEPSLVRMLAKTGDFDEVERHKKQLGSMFRFDLYIPDAMGLIDFPEAERLMMAKKAEAAGDLLVAGQLFASIPDHKEWLMFWKRNGMNAAVVGSHWVYYYFSASNLDAPILPDPHDRMDWIIAIRAVDKSLKAAYRMPQIALIYDLAYEARLAPFIASRPAAKLLELWKSGAIKSTDNMDASWLVTYREAIALSGDPSRIMELMKKIDIRSRRHVGDHAMDLLDWMLAVEAITPWIEGKSADFPSIPKFSSDNLAKQWPIWKDVATAIRNKQYHSDDGNDLNAGIAAEFMFSTGQYHDMTKDILSVSNPETRVSLAHDFATRMDRLCDARLYFPGEGRALRESMIFDFPAPKQ